MADDVAILIVTSRYYGEIAAELEAGTAEVLAEAGVEFDLVEVPGAFELPAAVGMAASTGEFDGYIVLGCVIRGETSHYDLICEQTARALMDISLLGVPLGFGLLTCETEEQARERADRTRLNKGREAAIACLRMIELSRAFHRDDE